MSIAEPTTSVATNRAGGDQRVPFVTGSFIKDRAFLEDLQRLRQTDNFTNVAYLLRAWLLIALGLGASVWFLVWRAGSGLHWIMDLPVLLAAHVWIGALQHQLATLGHEGSHFVLFRSRVLNEIASDGLCFFPLFSTTQSYRLQHLAHHKFVNDPERDPDMRQLTRSGHKWHFPKTKREVLALLCGQLLPLAQLRYSLGRMVHFSREETQFRVAAKQRRSRRIPLLVLVSLPAMIALLAVYAHRGDAFQLAAIPGAFALVSLAIFVLIPERLYGPRIARCPIPLPIYAVLRMGTLYTMFAIVAWTAWAWGASAATWLALLWVVPMLTTFALFNMIRQTLHHANADSGWMTNTRNFFMHPLLQFAIFPVGADMHLVHHIFSSVPHYRLKELHERMLVFPEYREQAVQVEGLYFRSSEHPTATEVLGPEFVPTEATEAFIDYEVDHAGLG